LFLRHEKFVRPLYWYYRSSGARDFGSISCPVHRVCKKSSIGSIQIRLRIRMRKSYAIVNLWSSLRRAWVFSPFSCGQCLWG